MLKNYFTTAINNLLKNKLYSAINIIGLAVGLAACIIITLYVQNELSYDKHWEKADLIHRINRGNSPEVRNHTLLFCYYRIFKGSNLRLAHVDEKGSLV